MSLVFLKEDGLGNIYDENGCEAMDIVDEDGDPYVIKQLVDLETYLEKRPVPSTTDSSSLGEHDEEMEGPSAKKDANRSRQYNDYGSTQREMFFEYKLQKLMSTRATALKAGVKERTARN